MGSPGDALTRQALAMSLCDGPLHLGAGTHTIDSAAGLATGVDVDRLILDNGVAAPAGPTTAVEVASSAATRIAGILPASTTDQYLVLRQSWNAGWRLSLDGHDLGPSVLIDGYANGWVVPPGAAARTFVMQWTPQHRVNIALILSAVALVAVAGLILVARRHPAGGWRTVAPAPRWVLPAAVALGPPRGQLGRTRRRAGGRRPREAAPRTGPGDLRRRRSGGQRMDRALPDPPPVSGWGVLAGSVRGGQSAGVVRRVGGDDRCDHRVERVALTSSCRWAAATESQLNVAA